MRQMLWLLKLAATSALLCLVLAFASQAQLANTRIAFMSDRDGNREIYMMDADGGNPTNLTKNPAWDDLPAWSADGRKIAFESSRDGDEIYVMNADGSNPTRLTNNAAAAYWPSWSPDGTKIAFTSYRDRNFEIYVINADGTNQVNLTNNPADDRFSSWSPDGTKIAFVSNRDRNYEIYVMNADGTNQTRLTDDPASKWSPSWSPDETKIAFTSYHNGKPKIYVMNADGTNQTRLTNNTSDDSFPSWSPDGTKIAFMSNRDGNFEIYVMNADGTNQTRLTDNPALDASPSWSPFFPASTATSSVTTFQLTATPTIVIADGISTSIITITVKDASGNPISGKRVTLFVSGTGNIITQPAPTNAIGQTIATLKSTKAETKTVSITIDGTPIATTAKVEFLPGAVGTDNSMIIASGNAIADETWGPAINISNTPGGSSHPAIATDASRNIHVVWNDDTPGNIKIFHTWWNGTSWSVPMNISSTATGSRIAIAIDSSGNLHVVWSDWTPGNQEIFYGQWNSTSRSIPTNISNTAGPSWDPAIAIDASGNVHVVWSDDTPALIVERHFPDIFYSRWNGTSWSKPVNVSNISGISWDPAIAIDASGNIHVVWHEDNLAVGEPEIFYSRWNGTSWSIPTNISNSAGSSRNPAIAIDASGNVYVVWNDWTLDFPDIFYSRWNGTSWSIPVDISNTSKNAQSPVIAIDASGNVYVVWSDDTPGTSEIFYSRWNGTSWSIPTNISNSAGSSRNPAIAIDASGNVYVVWSDSTPGNWEIFYSRKSADVVVKSVEPSSGSPTGGTAIKITGSGFQNGAKVSIGTSQATNVQVVSPTIITAVTPPITNPPIPPPLVSVDVVVTNPDGSSAKGTGLFTYNYIAPAIPTLSITAPTPNQVFPAATTSITLTVNIANYTGHWHWQLNKPFLSSGAAGGNMIVSGNTDTITGLTSGQTYTVYATLVDSNHNILISPVITSVTFSIAMPTLIESFITVNVSPETRRLNDKATIFGILLPTQISIPSEGLPISISYTSPTGKVTSLIVKTNLQIEYQATIEFTEVGKYKIQVQWQGDNKYKPSQQSLEFDVEKGLGKLNWTAPLPTDARYGEKISLIGQLFPKLKLQEIRVQMIRPDGIISKIEKSVTNEFGAFQIEVQMTLPGVWKIMAVWDGNDNYQSSQSEQISIIVKKETKAILVLGGGNETENPAWNTFAGLANYVYQSLKRRTLTDDDIYYLSPTLKKIEAIDDITTEGRLEFAITNWAAKRVGPNTPLLIYLLSHNLDDKFILEKQGAKEVVLIPDTLDLWLKHLPDGTPVTIIIEACHSGTFIEKKMAGKPVLPKPGRVVITSARSDRQAYILPNHSSFSKEFFDNIQRNKDIRKAFLETRDLLRRLSQHSSQFPQIDANGDGTANDPIRDFPAVEGYYIPDNIEALPAVPEILEISQPQWLRKEEKSATIQVRVRGVDIKRVFGTVIPPNFNPEGGFKSWEELAFDEINFQRTSDILYEGKYDKFTLLGTYSIVVYAENPDGSATPIEAKVTVGFPWDVNSDGEVNIFDIVIVAKNIGIVTKEGDVNSDGKVDIFDLVTVASHFSERSIGVK